MRELLQPITSKQNRTENPARMLISSNAKVSDGWPSSNTRIAKRRGGPAIRSTVWLAVRASCNCELLCRTLGPYHGEPLALDITKRRRQSLQLVHALKHRLSLSESGCWVGGEDEDVGLSTPDVVPVNIGGVTERFDKAILDRNHLVVISQ
jgi:hypothetical protein